MIKIAFAQVAVIPGQPAANCRQMIDYINQARASGAQIVVFPEMSIPGYFLGDTWEQSAFLRDCEYWGQKVIANSQDVIVVFGNVAVDWTALGDDGRVRKFNAAFVAYNGQLQKTEHWPYPFYIKTLQPNYREFDDNRHFFSLRKLAAELALDLKQQFQPLSIKFATRDINIGLSICEDAWDDNYGLKPLDLLSAPTTLDCLINISCSPYSLNKKQARHRIFSVHARQTNVPIAYVNACGLQNIGKTIYCLDGSSALYLPDGNTIQSCPSFTAGLFFVDSLPQQRIDDKQEGIDAIYTALQYGLRQFLQRLGVERVVIGASGGIDSAVAAALYSTILPPEQLLLINMPSRFNSQTTRSLAEQLALNIGCHYAVSPVDHVHNFTVEQIEDTPIINFHGQTPLKLTVSDFVRENIQARDRSSRILAAYAATWGAVFSCNANKAETTIGYSTLYGDHAGFLALLADLWKYQVYDLANYLNSVIFNREIVPQGSIDIVPSAELSANQAVDEGKGDPLIYPYHDYLFRTFVERWDRATPEDILIWYAENRLEQMLGCQNGLVKHIFPDSKSFIADLEKWWRLYSGMAIAKRIQAPPIMAVSRRPFGYDHREAQNPVYFTHAYEKLKEKLSK